MIGPSSRQETKPSRSPTLGEGALTLQRNTRTIIPLCLCCLLYYTVQNPFWPELPGQVGVAQKMNLVQGGGSHALWLTA